MNVIFYFSFTLLCFYISLIAVYLYGWITIPRFIYSGTNHKKELSFSIIIPVRNEKSTIIKCLEDIFKQQYDPVKFEVIIIDDHSTDDTVTVVQSFQKANPGYKVSLIDVTEFDIENKLKKAAITLGISKAVNEYIILTDADCERGTQWLDAINEFINDTNAKMIYAPVEFKANNMFEILQSLEFSGLVGIGAAAIQLKQPNMCSAANLIFEKNVFFEVEGYKGYDGIASGDDEFLMHKVFKRYPDNVKFLKDERAIVHTSANSSISQLTDQRRRWVSKSFKYENRYITAILVASYFFNVSIIYNLITNFKYGLFILVMKTGIELLFLFSVTKFFRKTWYLLFLPVAELFHILYVIIIGIWANTGTYNWKGRNVK